MGTRIASSKTPFYATDLGVARPERVDVGRDPVCGVDPYRPTVVGLEASVYDLCDRLPCGVKKKGRGRRWVAGGEKRRNKKVIAKAYLRQIAMVCGTYQRGGLLEKLVEEVKADLATFDAQLADAKEHE